MTDFDEEFVDATRDIFVLLNDVENLSNEFDVLLNFTGLLKMNKRIKTNKKGGP